MNTSEPVYGVTSFHRSGSSMMMRCLEAGGIETLVDEALDHLWNATASPDYQPNPNGFYNKDDNTFDWPTFHRDAKGKAIKIPRQDLLIVPRGAYRLIYMVRDPEEILASMRSFTPYRSWGHMEVAVHFYDLVRAETVRRLRERGDFSVLEVHYADVIADPLGAFRKIRDFGFPIDPEKSAAKVDPSLYRHRSS
jgi:hypothetical protein